MGRILGIDYGRKRVGIAVTDPLQMISNGLTTVASSEIFTFLSDYFAKEAVEAVVVGLPKTVRNEESESMKYIRPFVNRFKKLYPDIKLEMVDERFTSKLAFQAMIDGGLKKKDRRKKELVDTVSAAIILQSYLEHK